MGDAANSNSFSASNGGEKSKIVTDLATKRAKKRNEELKPIAALIKSEKVDKNDKEKERINHLMNKMITAMLNFIGKEEKSQNEALKIFKEDKESRNSRLTHPKTNAEDKKKENKIEERLQGLAEFRIFIDKLGFNNHFKRDDFKKRLDNTNTYHNKGLI